MADYPVVIVGGGIAGLGMANALAVRGIRSLVLEKTSSPGSIDRGDALHRSSIRIFRQWQVEGHLERRHPLRLNHFQILNREGDPLLAIDLSRDLSPPAEIVVLRHPEIQSVLEEAATERGAVVERSVMGVELETHGGRVVGVRTGRGVITAALTVLATGSHSALRDQVFPIVSRYDYPAVFINLRCRRLSEFGESAYYILAPQGAMMMLPLPNDEMRVGLHISADQRSPQLIEEIHAAIHERLQKFPVSRLEILARTTYTLAKTRCASFWQKGLAVIGDAAHTTHPAGGQGMNMAFQDADCLAQRLQERGLELDAIDLACSEYNRIRQREVKRVLAKTHLLGKMALVRNTAWVGVRGALLKCANSSRWIKQRIFNRIVEVS